MSSSSSESNTLTATQACAQQNEYAQICYSQSGLLGWLERSERTGQLTQLVCQSNTGVRRLCATDVSVGSSVHEYGGRAWCWGDDCAYYVERASQQLFCTYLTSGKTEQLTHQPNQRFMEPLWHRPTNSLIFIWELHSDQGVENRIGQLDLATGELTTLLAGNDFYCGLALNSNQTQLAWVTWNHPNLPWTDTEIFFSAITQQGLTEIRAVPRRRDRGESMAMPLFSDDGRLHFVSDREGYWSIYSYSQESDTTKLISKSDVDHISSPWQSGMQQYVPPQAYGLIRLEFSAYGTDLMIGTEKTKLSGFNHFRELCYHEGSLALIGAGTHEPLQILQIRLSDLTLNPERLTPTLKVFAKTSQAQLIEFDVEGTTVHGYYYSATNPGNDPNDSTDLPPALIITLHGGPTSSTYPIYNPSIQYWCDKGFAVFDLNYRGSSNSGRDYRFALKNAWGVSDIADITRAIEHLTGQNLALRGKVFIRGRSSGGFSALLALAKSNAISAATSYFGVMDPETLKQSTHKFESHYLDWLLPQDKGYDTPLSLANNICTPVLFLQGMRDKVVTPDQTQLMVDALHQRGLNVQAHYFEDEGHGFRQLGNQVRALEVELNFYQELLASAFSGN